MSNFFAMLSRMKHINRWSLMHNNRNENLSEHTLEVAMISHALIAIHNRSCEENQKLDCGKASLYAMYHDCSEILTGDLPTPVKYYNPSIKNAYKEVEMSANKKLISMLPDYLKEEYSQYFLCDSDEAKLYTPYIKAADKLSALVKCLEETKMGNTEFSKASDSTLNSIKTMANVPEAQVFLEEFMDAYKLTLDELY